MKDDLTESERERLRRLVVLQKLAGIILLKWTWLLLLAFVALAVGFSLFVVKHYSKSIHRFDANTQLLYNPRQVARIQNVSDKQLMSILDRVSIKRKIGDRIEMSTIFADTPEGLERRGGEVPRPERFAAIGHLAPVGTRTWES